MLDAGLSIQECADATGASPANVSRWFAAWRQDELARVKASAWVPDPEIEWMLAPWLPMREIDLRVAFPGLSTAERIDLADGLLDAAVESFVAFRGRLFRDKWGQPYRTPAVHRRWVRLILRALLFGRRQLILSPPRHGKTDLLRHLVIWMICRFPNIQILWIGGSETIARNATGSVLDELERNEALVGAVLGPGKSFKPQGRGGASWSARRAVVATRTETGLKSATIVAIGKGATMLSLDADWVIPDDVVDGSSVHGEGEGSDFEWFNKDVSSRKQDHTAITAIGSRRDHGDLWGRLINNQVWASAVERAHDPACSLPTHPFMSSEDHDPECPVCAAHVDCMLFPEIGNSFTWLQDQRASYADDRMWEMVYQNITRPDGADPVTDEQIEAARDYSRRIGEVPSGCRLIAGLDPASSGFQAAVLWAVDLQTWTRNLVDIDVDKGGGIEGFRRVLREWFEKYGLQHWVYEAIGAQAAYGRDRDVVEYRTNHNIRVDEQLPSNKNYYHPEYGVPKQLDLFKHRIEIDGEYVPAPLISLPAADDFSRAAIREYEQQVKNFEPGNKRQIKDILMAGWQPDQEIRSWRMPQVTTVSEDREGGYLDYHVADMYQPMGDVYDAA